MCSMKDMILFNEGHDPSHCGEFKSIEEGLPVDQVPN